MDTLNTLSIENIGTFEVRTLNSTYLVETPELGETWVTRFSGSGELDHDLRRDGDRLPCMSIRLGAHDRMEFWLTEVDDYEGYGATFRSTSPVLSITRIT